MVRLTAMERMLTAVGTTPAVRELISFHAYFGEMFRIDLQRQIAKLRDKAVPALIEARQHDAKIVQRWANKELDALGRAIPGEAVASSDTQILADVLRAYGRTRDVDAVRVILSFANSDRVQLREASREAVAAIGDPGIWQLRDQYLSLTGNKAPKDWAWDRIARELFALYDRARLAEVYKLMDEGSEALSHGKVLEATAAFDKVLARSPLFERRKEMVKAYFTRAGDLEGSDKEAALVMMRKALRLDPKGELAKSIEAEVAYLEAAITVDHGAPDKTAFQRALDLDPKHERARKALASLEDQVVERQSQLPRYGAAAGIGVVALIAMILLARRRPSPKASEA
jgi:tetratricopeptide (TPR) repeat protein